MTITKFGTGSKVLVIHGGPGFNSDYLIEPLRKLSDRNTFVFYNQGYVEPTLEGCSKELLSVIDEELHESSVCVVAHSWGCLVLLSALAWPDTKLRFVAGQLKSILINPVPITKQLFGESIAAFQQNIPDSVLEEAMQLALSGADGSDVMAMLLPYYVSNQEVCDVLRLPLSFSAYQSVLSSLPDFDFSAALPQLANSHVLLGDNDITPRHTIQNILDASGSVKIISGSGHFPLHEQPDLALPHLATWLG